jgi:hypothetical protein
MAQAGYKPDSERTGRRWTSKEDGALVWLFDEYLGQDKAYEAIGRKLRRSPGAVQQRAIKSLGLHRTLGGHMTTLQVAELLGSRDGAVRHWVRAGRLWLKPHKRTRNTPYAIDPDDLWVWLEDSCSWDLWEPDAITDREWRQHFTDLRRGWITTREAAKILGYGTHYTPKFRERHPWMRTLQTGQHGLWLWWRIEDVQRLKTMMENG